MLISITAESLTLLVSRVLMVQQQDWRTIVDQLRDCAVHVFVGVFHI